MIEYNMDFYIYNKCEMLSYVIHSLQCSIVFVHVQLLDVIQPCRACRKKNAIESMFVSRLFICNMPILWYLSIQSAYLA